MKANEEIRNDELKVAMITLKLQDDKESEEYFTSELKKAYFLIPAYNDNKSNEFTFMLLCDQNDNNYFQAYTDKDEYNKWPSSEEATNFVLTFDELAHIIINSEDDIKGLTINPFSENIILNKDYLKDVFNLGKIFIDELSSCPTKIKNVIKKILKVKNTINKAYLMNIKKNNIPGYLLIIDSSTKDKSKLFEEIGKSIVDNIKDINIDIISSKDDLAKDIIKNKKELYKKKTND